MFPTDDLALCFVCRLCKHMAQAAAHGRDQCGQPCGGPSKGMAFPHYWGQIQRAYLLKYCYKCGKDATRILDVGGMGKLGVCETHAKGGGAG